jgi:hypothetical protein
MHVQSERQRASLLSPIFRSIFCATGAATGIIEGLGEDALPLHLSQGYTLDLTPKVSCFHVHIFCYHQALSNSFCCAYLFAFHSIYSHHISTHINRTPHTGYIQYHPPPLSPRLTFRPHSIPSTLKLFFVFVRSTFHMLPATLVHFDVHIY